MPYVENFRNKNQNFLLKLKMKGWKALNLEDKIQFCHIPKKCDRNNWVATIDSLNSRHKEHSALKMLVQDTH